jgi:eukaryotic-like serine/threonine-protein kinase
LLVWQLFAHHDAPETDRMSGLESLLTDRVLVKRYRIREVIGRGGFAAVYRADDERLGRPVAVKVITVAAPDDQARQQIRARFDREARAAAALPHHPNVVTVHDFGTDPELGLDFLVMELLVGEDLATHLAGGTRPPAELAMRILRDTVEGIAVGHRAGLIHRDVKPGNVFLAEPHGGEPFRVCVLDFGIARIVAEEDASTRLTAEQNPLSPAYASPEQLRGERDLTAASDVYSLGVVGYQLLTGEKPAAGAAVRPVREANPEVPEAIAGAIDRAMASDPSQRFADADAFAAALDAAVGGGEDDRTAFAPVAVAAPGAAASVPPDDGDRTILHPVAAPPPAPPPHVERRRPEKRRSGTPAAFMVVLLLAVAGGAWWLFAQDGRRGDDVVPVVAEVDTGAADPQPDAEGAPPSPPASEPIETGPPAPADPTEPGAPPPAEPNPLEPPAQQPPPQQPQPQPPQQPQPQQPQPSEPRQPQPQQPPPTQPQPPPPTQPPPQQPTPPREPEPQPPPPNPPVLRPVVPAPPDTIRIP